MNRVRLVAAMIVLAQIILLVLVFDLTGRSAILFSFVGHPVLAVGLILGGWWLYGAGNRDP